METVLYADILFLVNFAMDFISLAASASLGAKEKRPLRICLASALGAIYAIAATVSDINGGLQYILASLVGASMCAISFGFGGIFPFFRQCIIFWGCGALLGGIMTAILSMGGSLYSLSGLPVIAIASCVVLFFIIKSLKERAGCKSLKIKIELCGKELSFEALCDSGNLLRDPFTGSPVIIASHKILCSLLTEETVTSMLQCNTHKLSESRINLRLIPHGNSDTSGILCAFRPDSVTVTRGTHSAKRSCLVAVSPHHATYFAGFAATAPSVLIP